MLPIECVVRGYLTGSGWKDYLSTGRGLRAPAPGRACASRSGSRRRSSRRRRRRRRATTRTSTASRPPSSSATELLAEVERISIGLYEHAAAHAAERGILIADTKFELGLDPDGVLTARRRGAHARLLPLLAGRRVRARPRASPRSTSNTCATTASRSAGTRTAPAPSCRPRSWIGTRARYVEAFERLTGHPLRRLPRRPGGRPPVRATVLVRPKDGILDPQGEAVERSLRQLGFTVGDARVGRVIDLEVDARASTRPGPRSSRCASACSPTR